MNQKVYEILNELVEEGPRAFPSKYAGTCALTGTKFYAGTSIRYSKHGYFSNEALGALSLRISKEEFGGETPEEAATRCQPFDFDLFMKWMEEGSEVNVYGSHISKVSKYCGMNEEGKVLKQANYGHTKASEAQVRNWTKTARFMMRIC